MLASVFTLTTTAFTLGMAAIQPADPSLYEIVSLNNFCNNKENKLVLENSSSPRSAGIATATQLRDRRGSIGCGYEFEAKESMGLIVSVVDMNLRAGVLNESCTDYITFVTDYNLGADKEKRCGRVTGADHYHFATPRSVSLKLFAKSPLSHFFDGYILGVVATSYVEPEDGSCGPNEFMCSSGDRCIYRGYRCDKVNNCGDNSDEDAFGNSMCLMPLSSLILIILGLADLVITWIMVFYCCVRSALTRKKSMHDDRWAVAAPPGIGQDLSDASDESGSDDSDKSTEADDDDSSSKVEGEAKRRRKSGVRDETMMSSPPS